MRVLHDIIYEPSFYGVIPIHHTNPNGRVVTFQTPAKLLTDKKLETPQSNSTDYTFKIGGTTDNFRDGNDAAWTSLPLKTFAEFKLLEVPVNSHVLVIYNGELEQTDVVSALYSTMDAVPVNPSMKVIRPNPKIAAGDIMIYPKMIVGVSSVIANQFAIIYSEKRTFEQLTNSSDLISFNSGIANLSLTNENETGHLFLQSLYHPTSATISITNNQSDNKKEIISYATPLTNYAYPLTADGTNVKCFTSNHYNDTCYLTDASDFIFNNVFNIPTWSDGQSVTLYNCNYNYNDAGTFVYQVFMDVGLIGYGTARISFFSNALYFCNAVFSSNLIYTGYSRVCIVVTKVTGTTLNVKWYVNGNITADTTADYNPGVFSYIKANYDSNKRVSLADSNTSIGGKMIYKQTDTWIKFSKPTKEEIRRFALGEEPRNPDLHWDFKQETGLIVPELATGRDGTLYNTSGTRTNFF